MTDRKTKTPRILLTGANGQLGFELRRSLAPVGEILALDRKGCDLANPDMIRRVVRQASPDIIVNAGAYTAVDKAESDASAADAINGVAPGVLAEEARALGALLVHYSTDYVFSGEKPGYYSETDVPDPVSVYARSKFAGEQAVLDAGADAWIFRTSWVFSPHGGNFLKTIMRLARTNDSLRVVNDQFGAPTSASLVADVTAHALRQGLLSASGGWAEGGVYHLVASGETTWYEFARAIVERMRDAGEPLKVQPEQIVPIPSSEFPVPARRPANSRLSTAKLRGTFGVHLPEWQQCMHYVLDQLED